MKRTDGGKMLSKVLLPADFSESNRILVEGAKRPRSETDMKELIPLHVIDGSAIEKLRGLKMPERPILHSKRGSKNDA